jgi:hypothetical protein
LGGGGPGPCCKKAGCRNQSGQDGIRKTDRHTTYRAFPHIMFPPRWSWWQSGGQGFMSPNAAWFQ